MSKELKAYFWWPAVDSEYGVAIVAHSVKEAKKLGWDYWGKEYGNDDDFIDQVCQLKKNVDTSGLEPCAMYPGVKSLKRGFYAWVEVDCPICGFDRKIIKDDETGKCGCEECIRELNKHV